MTRCPFALTLAALVLAAHSGFAQQTVTAPSPPTPQRPARDQAAAETGTAIIRGRVVAADSGAPLRRAQVRASSPTLREGRIATTDASGKYELKDLPAGRFSLSVTKGSYVTLSYGQRTPNEAGKPIELAEGQVLEHVDVSLPRGSVISGRIVDEFGEPMAGTAIQVMRSRAVGGGERRLIVAGPSVNTDDLGQFRAYGLPPGQYVVSATLRSSILMATTAESTGYPPTYYPGTLSMNEAQRLTVATGVEVPNISFALIPARVAKVTGTIVDSSGKPAANAQVVARQTTGRAALMVMMSSGPARVTPGGTFTINNVVPGEYTLDVRVGGGDAIEFGSATFAVAGDDIAGLMIVTGKGATARGRVVFEGGIPPNIRLETLQARSIPGSGLMIGSPAASVQPDGAFEVRALFGKMMLSVGPAPQGWRVKEVRLNGSDVPSDGYPFSGAEEVEGFQVILTNQTNEVSGAVSDDKGLPINDYVLIVFSTTREKWTTRSGHVQSTRPDQSGRAKITNLPAGDYYAVAIESIEPGEESDPELLDRLQRGAQKFSIGASGAASVALKLTRLQ